MWIPIIFLVVNIALASPFDDPDETTDGDHSRKILGSSVVTSVSVIMDTGNGTKAVYTDSLGRPLGKPSAASELASPIDLLNPDRYEFYTFDDDGNLVRRLMSLDEIRGIIATGDSDGLEYDSLSSQNYIPENRVNDVLNNVQGVLKGEMELHKKKGDSKPIFDTPDVSDSWSMILPAIFGNSGADINPEKTQQHVTPDTIMVETTQNVASSTGYTASSSSTTESATQPVTTSSSTQRLMDTTSERLPSSLLPLETKDSVEIPSTEAILVTTQKQDNAVTAVSEEVTITEVSSSPSSPLTTTERETSTTEANLIPVSSTTMRSTTTTVAASPQTSETVLQEQDTTTMPPLLKSSVTSSQELSSTEKYLPVSTNPPPIVTMTEGESPSSSTYPPLVRSTESATTGSSTERELPSSVTNLPSTNDPSPPTNVSTPAVTESSSTERETLGSSTNLPGSTTNVTSSMATVQEILSSTSTIPTERVSEEPVTTTERRFNADTTEVNENYASTPPLETNKTQVSTSEIINQLMSTTNTEFETEIVDQSDNRFETTQRTTEVTTDRSLMGSIQELLSQTLQNVDEIVMDLNKTDVAENATIISSYVNDVEITTMSPPSTSEKLVSSVVTEPNIYQIISSSNMSSVRNVSKESVDTTASSLSNDSPMMKITILNPESDVQNSLKPGGSSEVPTKNTKTDKTSELNTTQMQPQTTEVSKHDEVLTTTTELYYVTESTTLPSNTQTEKLSTDMLTTIEAVDEQQTTEALREPSIEIIINESKNITSNNGTEQSQNTTDRPTKTTVTEKDEETPTTIIEETEKPIVRDSDKTEANWTLVSTIKPHAELAKPQTTASPSYPELIRPPQPIDLEPKPLQGFGLEDSTSTLDHDIYQYSQLCNELAFSFWKQVTTGLSSARSIFVSPFGAISLLAMIFLGARGSTSGEMNEMLKLDDMVTFNPHLIFKNVSESIDLEKANSGVVASAIVRELFSDRARGMLLPFYKERAKAFYDGFVEEINFGEIGDVIRRRTNLQVKKYSDGKVGEFLKDSFVTARSPLAGISVNVFQTDCTNTSTSGRDGEMHFVVLPSIRQRRLVPIPAVVYRSNFLAGYDPSLDATAVALGTKDQIVSTILVIPGQQGMPAPGDGLARLEKSLVEGAFRTGAWSRLLRTLIPRTELEVQIPRVIHRSVINATMALKRLGFTELFDEDRADLRGMNGVPNELYMSDILQINSFTTCVEIRNADSHHSEIYPANVISRRLEKSLAENSLEDIRMNELDPLMFDNEVPLPLRPRQARVPEIPRLRFDRPFLYFVRHNPTGLILHIGRFNPRLLP